MLAYPSRIKMLIAIASYGCMNDRYLERVVDEYRRMSFEVNIVIHSDIKKHAAHGVKVVTGLPFRDACSLPYAHKSLFANSLDDYDLFLYSEDDILISEKNIQAFLKAVQEISTTEIPGFIRVEEDRATRNYPDFRNQFHWDPKSLRHRGEYTLARFTNEHAACYLMTKDQLRSAIDSGGYLVAPHCGKYDMICTAATDPYTQCGFEKVVCISHIDEFLVNHLSNRYIGSGFGVSADEFDRQIRTLLEISKSEDKPEPLFATETKLRSCLYSKEYYEEPRREVASSIDPGVTTILSVGCGSGATEAWLAKKGFQVTAVPLDRIIASSPLLEGIEVVPGTFDYVLHSLEGRRFDCLLLLNVLHLIDDPARLLGRIIPLLSKRGSVIASVPNMARIARPWKKSGWYRYFANISYQGVGAHYASATTLRKWLNAAGMYVVKTESIIAPQFKMVSNIFCHTLDSLVADEVMDVARVRES